VLIYCKTHSQSVLYKLKIFNSKFGNVEILTTFVALVMGKNRTYTILVWAFFCAMGIQAQEQQGPYLYFLMLKNNDITYYPNNYQANKIIFDPTDHGSFVLGGTKYNPTVSYTPDAGFIGRDTASYEYKDLSGKFKYISFVFDVRKSVIVSRADVFAVDQNSGDIDYHPLLNDSSTIDTTPSHLALHISNFSAAPHLVVSTPNDTTLRVRPDPGFTGQATVNYTICDSEGACIDASLIINVVESSNLVSDSMYLGTPKATHKLIVLPQSGYSTHEAPDHGVLEFNTDFSILYKPVSTFTGKDTFVVVSNGIYRTVFMEVYPMPVVNKIVVNDYFFAPKDSSITGSVATNDIVNKYPFLKAQDPVRGTLTLNTNGSFTYVPEAGFEGVESFVYKVCPQGNCEYGTVKMFIGNWEPDTRTMYKFSTPKNVPIVISYHIPITGYTFTSQSDSVRFYPGFDTIYLDYKGCKDTVSGYNLLVYYTPKDYAGIRTFEVEYCIPATNECVIAEVEVSIYDEGKNCSLHCPGDCVWPGDVNLDGEVSMMDLLSLGYHLGIQGPSRVHKSTTNFRALRSSDWDSELTNGFANLKHADTDGDGTVDYQDTLYISNFYRKQHSLVPRPVYDRGDFPFILHVVDPNVGIGDLARIEVQLGDETYPAINLAGYAYELDYNVNVVNEATLEVGFYYQEWAAQNASVLHMYQKPWDGRLESGFARANAKKVSGRGGTELITFIVEDDLDGFRNGTLKIPFFFTGITVMDSEGRLYRLPDQTVYLEIEDDSDKEPRLDADKLIVYPVPADHFLKLYLNGRNSIHSVDLVSMSGQNLRSYRNIDGKQVEMDLEGLENGIYLLRTETELGPIVKKFEILR
jgi:hypothetical protein